MIVSHRSAASPFLTSPILGRAIAYEELIRGERLFPPCGGRMRSLGERSEPRRSWMGGDAARALVRTHQRAPTAVPNLPDTLSSTIVRRHPPSLPSPTRGEGAHRAHPIGRGFHMR